MRSILTKDTLQTSCLNLNLTVNLDTTRYDTFNVNYMVTVYQLIYCTEPPSDEN